MVEKDVEEDVVKLVFVVIFIIIQAFEEPPALLLFSQRGDIFFLRLPHFFSVRDISL